MNRGLGILLVIAAAVSVIGYPQGQPNPGGYRPADSGTNSSLPAESSENIAPESCVVSDRLECNCSVYCPLQDLTDTIKESFAQPGSNENLGVPKDQIPKINFIIAIVPDPVHTHLSLFFDHSIDAVEEAAQQQGYIFNRATLPWDYQTHAESNDFRLRLRQTRYSKNREKLPGLMIFRRTKSSTEGSDAEALFVFVVGETPTAGVHKEQFQNALKVMFKIRTGKTEPPTNKEALPIMGPTFSGSLYSLSALLHQPDVEKHFGPIIVHSGTASSWEATHWFEQSFCHQVHFAAFQESDRYAIRRFMSYATAQGYRPDDIAVLSEEETAYGAGIFEGGRSVQPCNDKRRDPDPTDDEQQLLQLFFPREISQLRSAFQRDLRSDEAADSSSGRRPSRSTLRLNLEDTGGDDTVPSYSKLQEPLSQEALLLGIVTNLQKHQSQFVIIRSTNPLDQLFLVRYLRIAYPEGRIVTTGGDMLFRREIETNLLHGTLAITTYSMLPGAEDAIARPAGSNRKTHTDFVFANFNSAGTYNAMLSLLSCLEKNNDTEEACRPGAPLENGRFRDLNQADYAEYGWPDIGGKNGEPAASTLAPPLLLMALGRYGYWRLALLDSSTYGNPDAMQPPSNLHSIRGIAELAPFETYVPGPWKLLCGVFSGTLLIVMVLMKRGSVTSASEAMAMFAAIPSPERKKVLYLLGLLLLAMLLMLIGPWLRWKWRFHHDHPWFGWAILAWFMYLAARLGCSWIFDLRRRETKRWETILFCVISLLLVAHTLWFYMLGPDAQKNLFLYRYVQFASGLSPALPWLLLICSALWWTWYTLAGLALLDERRPRLPAQIDPDPSASLRLGSCQLTEATNSQLLRAAMPFSLDLRVYLPAALAALIAMVVVNYRHPVHSMEGKVYDVTYGIAFGIGVLWLLCTLLRLAVTWLECRRLLMALDSLPLRRSFKWLSGFSWKPIWRLRGSVLQDSFRIIERQMDSLVNLGNTVKDLEKNPCASRDWETLQNLKSPSPSPPGQSLGEQLENDVKTLRDNRTEVETKYKAAREQLIQNSGVPQDKDLVQKFTTLQAKLAHTCGTVFVFLQCQWNGETCTAMDEDEHSEGKTPSGGSSKKAASSRRDELPLATRLAEEFVCLVYVNFILSVLMRMRTLVMAVVGMFVFLLLSIGCYPFEPKQSMYSMLIVLFLVIVGFIAVVYAQMHRDATLSRITDTKPGELGFDFWIRLAGFSAVPLLSLLLAQYPEFNSFLFSWLEPALQGWR